MTSALQVDYTDPATGEHIPEAYVIIRTVTYNHGDPMLIVQLDYFVNVGTFVAGKQPFQSTTHRLSVNETVLSLATYILTEAKATLPTFVDAVAIE